MVDDIMLETEEGMEKAIKSLETAFSSVRTGRANAMILEKVKVEYYGVPTPVTQMAAVKTPDAHMLVIEPWDKGTLGAIEHAIMESNLGVTPNNDGTCIRLPFPSLTEERRKELVKQCRKYAEEARVAVRNSRREGNTQVEKEKKAGDISEDDERRAEESIQKLTNRYVKKVDDILQKKEEELMAI
ncbi:MAG: ribosome recycling factor [Eggerthellaceae bacterium]|jgi:ribosome recycling factor